MEDFVFGDISVALGGCRGEDAVAFAERLECFRFGSLVDGLVRVEDSNCVLNTTIDLDGASPTTATNLSKGATEYLNILTDYDLTDFIRESIGNDTKLFTNHTHVAGGSVTRTRIDHIHAPQIDAIIWKYIPAAPDFLTFQRTFGHDMIQIEARIVLHPERGRDLSTINESIFDDADFNDELATLIKNTMTEKNPDANGWGAAWEATKAAIRTRCIAQTKTLRRQEDEETARIKAELSYVEAAIKGAGTHTDASSYTTRDELKKQLTERTRTRRSLNDMLEKEAYENGRKHDVNTAAFHASGHPRTRHNGSKSS